jgi:putative ABC transport system permease protein
MWREYVRIALRALRAHKFRSALTVSSITLGAFSIVFMSSLATSGLATLAHDIEELGGARIIMIAPKRPERVQGKDDSAPGLLTAKDREVLFSALPHTSARTMYATLDRKDVINDRGDTARSDFVAADAGFFEVLNLQLADGRFFTEQENKRHARVCVVAHDLANHLWEGKAVGRWLTVAGDRCLVIGQLAKVDHWDTNFGFKWLDFVVMPLETAAETLPEVRRESFIQLKTDAVASNEIVKRVANAILVDRHHGVDDFQIWDFNAFMKQFYVIFALMEAVVGLIAGIALLVGGVGVMNMMLVSVSERTREIGIRKALGASPGAIAAQFLCEAAVLAGLGGLSGTFGGVVAATAANYGIKQLKSMWIGEISEPAVIVAIAVSILIGISFGFFPAKRASQLDPVLAIRG